MSERTGTPPAFVPPTTPDTRDQLEFARALEEVAARAVGPLGAASVRARLPVTDRERIAAELSLVTELQELLATGAPFRPEPIVDITPPLEELRVPGAALEPIDLLALGSAFEAMRRVRAELLGLGETAPRVSALAVETPPTRVGRELQETFEPDGRVRDGADEGVDRARRRARDARTHLIQFLERVLRGLAAHEAAPDAAVTMRSGRYVIPVHADARGRVRGIVHAESASGGTLFVEPEGAVELGNQLANAEADEQRAVHAVLCRLSDAARPHGAAAAAGLAMCVAVDDLYARARYAVDTRGVAPRLETPDGVHDLRHARHPLLLAERVDAVPFDLLLEPDERALIVSGPNAGGKTVLLKTVGVVSAMVQAGIVPPVGEGSRVPVYAAILTDIGDHQSIAANLSTFSAHLAAVRRALELAAPGVLVLIDEIGSGTDPAEGAALAAAVLQALVTRRSRTIATTHLGALKALATESAGVVNASLRFDAATLTPTFELVKGVPGRSYGLAIARRLGIPESVVAAADARRPAAERTLETMLADVEQRAGALAAREQAAAEREVELGRREAVAARLGAEGEAREVALRERETTLEREGREQARSFLLDARKRVDEALGVARAAVSEAAAKEARRLVEQGIAEEAGELRRLAERGWRVKGVANSEPDGGVHPPDFAGRDGAKARSALTGSPIGRAARLAGDQGTAIAPRTGASEVDLRGMTAEDAREAVTRCIDDAVLADLPVVRIIHGKGTGVLRKVVDETLRRDRRVGAHRLAPPREGGAGVTVAELV